MAIEKILNTRIGLKVDTLENWGKSTLPLKKGEVAFATVAASAGNGLTEPVVMMKIGEDGVKTFKDIEWNFYAKASDVLASCKSEDALKTFINGVIADADMATNDKFTELSGKVDTLNGDVNTAGSVAKAIKDAIDALDLANTYVAKEDGKSLVDDDEITKLAGVSTGANKVESSTNGKIKIDGVDTVVYTHPEKHTVSEISDFDDKIKEYKYTVEGHTHVKTDITDFAHTHTVSEITDFDTEVKKYDYATKAEAQGYANAKDGAIAEAKKAGTDAVEALNTYKGEMVTALNGKQDVIPANTYDSYGSATQALTDAKKYTDNEIAKIPAQTDYTVTITETTDGLASDIAKKYTFTQNGAEIGSINLAKELVVTSGSVKEVKTAGTPYADAKVGDKYIELIIANQNTPIYVPAKDLVDIYTAKTLTADSTDEVKITISNTNEISATLVDGKIAKGKLASDVQASLGLADSAVQEADITDLRNAKHTHTFVDTDVVDAISKKHAHTFVETELNKIKDGDVAKWNAAEQNAKDYTDDEIEALSLGTMSKETATDYVKKSEATGYGDILTKTEAQNAYQAKGEYYTKTEADAAFTNSTEVDGQIDAKITALDLANTYQAKGNYATAEQGGKADSALQEITTTANGGLKVTNKNQIDIDENIVFVFDCGDAEVTA